MRTKSFNVIILISVVFVSTLFGELLLSLFFPLPDPFYDSKHTKPYPAWYIRSEFPANLVLTTYTEEGLSGMPREGRFTTNNYGFRGDSLVFPKPVNEIRLFIVGGSTVECLYLDDTLALNFQLQNVLNSRTAEGRTYKVYGAGKSGDASDDHVAMISQRIVHLEPDIIVLLAGVNDLFRAIYNHDYLHLAQTATVSQKENVWKLAATEFQIPRRLHALKKIWFPTDEEIQTRVSRTSDYAQKVKLCMAAPPSNVPPRVDLSSFQRNLLSIIGLCKANNITLLLMTQPSTWNSTSDPRTRNWHWLLLMNGFRFSEPAMDSALGLYNDVTRSCSRMYDVPLYDLAAEIPKSLQYFYDDVHLNVEGVKLVAFGLSRHLLARNNPVLHRKQMSSFK